MANQLQKLIYEGYLTADPELRFTPAGKEVCNFRIGSNRSYKTAEGEVVKETTWLKITAWGKLGEIVNKYCGVGSHVIVTGILRVGKNGSPTVYQMQNGEYASSYEVTAEEVRILKGKDNVTAEGAENSAPAEDNSDLPY